MTETVKHTPGPWADIKGYIVVKSGHTLASVNSHNTGEGKANALLIASAPLLLEQRNDLLETLKHIAKTWPDSFAAHSARAAIAKAEGRS